MDKSKDDENRLPLRIPVRLVERQCGGCLIRGSKLCSLCASLVKDETGKLWISLRPVDNGDGWQKVNVCDLAEPPKALLVE